jgi:hypothetical protein
MVLVADVVGVAIVPEGIARLVGQHRPMAVHSSSLSS